MLRGLTGTGLAQPKTKGLASAVSTNMASPIEGQTAQHAGGMIAAQGSRPSVRDLMQDDAEKHRDKSHGEIGNADGKRRIEHRIALPRSADDRKDKEAP